MEIAVELPGHVSPGQFLNGPGRVFRRQAELAPNLVGTPNDIRRLIAYRTRQDLAAAQGSTPAQGARGSSPAPASVKPPKLARGWRAELVGNLFQDLLAGKTSIRIDDPTSDHPLVFQPDPGRSPGRQT